MKNVKITYPGYVTKSFTMSYDDGSEQDKRIIALFKKYGIKGTFFLNTRFNGSEGYMNHLGYEVWVRRPKDEDIRAIYEGFEAANHTVSHPMIGEISKEEMEYEVCEASKTIEKNTGVPVHGMGYPGNSYGDLLISLLPGWGIEYGRLASSGYNFNLPENFYKWEPCCHDADDRLPELSRQYVDLDPDSLTCLYVWGHSYELDKPGVRLWDDVGNIHDRWANFEKFLSFIGGRSDIWYATNLEVCRYVNAVRKSEITENGIKNNSDITLYAVIDGKKTEIPPHTSV